MAGYYINAEVRKMYGIPLSQLTPEQRRILKADGERRKKLIEERQKDFMRNNKRAFEDAEKLNKVLAAIYAQCQKDILADVSETIAKVKGVSSLVDDGASNMALVTGGTSSLGNKSGNAPDGEDGKKSVTYRGEENLWGNIWT